MAWPFLGMAIQILAAWRGDAMANARAKFQGPMPENAVDSGEHFLQKNEIVQGSFETRLDFRFSSEVNPWAGFIWSSFSWACKTGAASMAEVVQECLEGQRWDVLRRGAEGREGCTALGEIRFRQGSLYGAVCPGNVRQGCSVRPECWAIDLTREFDTNSWWLNQLNHNRRLSSKCKKGSGQEECDSSAGFF
ncbi:hypothetical protein BTVI_75905 [Pitangus sulphuratus]|nr:hypothetical protein BTVI_75905 [Pitangus sulphuratus]